MKGNVLILAETKSGQLRSGSLEALHVARQVAKDAQVFAVLVGAMEETQAAEYSERLTHYGADRVYIANDPKFRYYTPDGYMQVLRQLYETVPVEMVIFTHTAIGRDIAPRFAARLGAGLISDCIKAEWQGDKLLFTRPIYAGKALQTKQVVQGPVLLTIRPNNFELAELDPSRKTDIVNIDVKLKSLRTVVRERVSKNAGSLDLAEAKVVVAGGRGVKSADGFKPLQELAEVLGGAVGASRGACDAGYCDYSLQIGQTGKVVTPDLYIACGISGAIQHLAGMSASRVIVAINKDPEAPIFQIADYGIVGDLFEIVPLLTQQLQNDTT